MRHFQGIGSFTDQCDHFQFSNSLASLCCHCRSLGRSIVSFSSSPRRLLLLLLLVWTLDLSASKNVMSHWMNAQSKYRSKANVMLFMTSVGCIHPFDHRRGTIISWYYGMKKKNDAQKIFVVQFIYLYKYESFNHSQCSLYTISENSLSSWLKMHRILQHLLNLRTMCASPQKK